MSYPPTFTGTPNNNAGLLTAGDTSRTAPTTFVTIMTAGASGSRCDNVDFVGVATTTASAVRLFLYDGTTYHLLTEQSVIAITASAGNVFELHLGTNAASSQIFPIVIPTLWSLRATVNDTQTGIKAIARGGNF